MLLKKRMIIHSIGIGVVNVINLPSEHGLYGLYMFILSVSGHIVDGLWLWFYSIVLKINDTNIGNISYRLGPSGQWNSQLFDNGYIFFGGYLNI